MVEDILRMLYHEHSKLAGADTGQDVAVEPKRKISQKLINHRRVTKKYAFNVLGRTDVHFYLHSLIITNNTEVVDLHKLV